jgi:hypothetical protein
LAGCGGILKIPSLQRLREENCDCEASLECLVRPCLQKYQIQKEEEKFDICDNIDKPGGYYAK